MSLSIDPSASAASPAVDGENFAAVVARRAADTPDALALRLLGDGDNETATASYGELHAAAGRLSAALRGSGAEGKTVLLAHSPGLDFVTGLLGCWHAGAIAVPCYPPQGRRHTTRLEAVLNDSGATLALADETSRTALESRGLSLVVPGDDRSETPAAAMLAPCLLQYTSGSTARPKGVRIHHSNLLHQLRRVREGLAPLGLKSALSWLPPYHDMGLVLKILLSLESGLPLTMMVPEDFVRSPLRWLRAISRYRADFSGGPNFAFELCVRAATPEKIAGLDLSCWSAAPCGAERIRPETLDRFARTFESCGFRHEAFLPGYGLAEATLIVAARRPGAPLRTRHGLISCGPPLEDMNVRIDPASQELLVRGPSVASGYWKQDFHDAGEGWLATGDRGFLDEGELFIEGRLKDLLILDGINHSPDDIEAAAADSCEDLPGKGSAAFPVERAHREQATLVQEAPAADKLSYAERCARIRAAVGEATGVSLDRVILVRTGSLPRTTSGKIQRSATREAFLNGSLRVMHDEGLVPSPAENAALPAAHRAAFELLCQAIREATDRPSPLPFDDPAAHGLGSIDVTRVAAILRERTGAALPVGQFYAERSFADLAARLSGQIADSVPMQIPVRADGEEPVLTHSQERMWFLHQLDPQSAAYHVFGALDMHGPLDAGRLDRSFRAILQRHEILRSRYENRDGRPRVRIVEAAPGIEVDGRPTTDLAGRLKDFASHPFDLADEALVRAVLLTVGPEHQVLGVCAHHIVADGWTIRLLLKELFDGYRGETIFPGASYLDYAARHRRWIEAGAADDEVNYWKHRIQGAAPVIPLPLDFPRPARPIAAGDAVRGEVSAELLEKIRALAISRRATPFAVFLAGFQLLLQKHGGGDSPVIAVPVANRHHPGSGSLFGTLVNTLPYRLELRADETFAELVDRVRDATFEMLAAQDAPFEKIIEAVQPERSLEHAPLTQVMFDHQEIPFEIEWPGGLKCQPLVAHRGAAQFDLSLFIFALPEAHEIYFEYRTSLFSRHTAEALLERYLTLLERTVSAPANCVRGIEALTPADRQRIRQASHGPDCEEFLHCHPLEEIRRAASLAGDRRAVICGAQSQSYTELLDQAGGIARHLLATGLQPGDRVAVMLDRDIHLPATLLGIWMTGAAYVPLDPANPPARLELILEDQAPIRTLVSPRLSTILPVDGGTMIFDPAALEAWDGELPPLSPDRPAYILYTSGSTGKPKGVVVSHAALGNFLLSMQEQPGITDRDRLAAITTLSFDISALELFLPLVTGATVEVIPSATSREGAALGAHLKNHPPTLIQATPATWSMLIDSGWQGCPELKILCGGEALDPALATELSCRCGELWNLYGPTETTIWSTLWRVPKKAPRIAIGKPIANTILAILQEGGTPVPPGVAGELLIGGAGLADGYWQREELNRERFTVHDGQRFYRTGDLAKWLPDGTVECLGRLDGQVKIRGFRIETGEIEAAMSSHPQVAEAAVAVDLSKGEPRLFGYYRSRSALGDVELREHLQSRLPSYMLPGRLSAVAEMPLTSSGKIDRRALLSLRTEIRVTEPSANPASDPLTVEICELWRELLKCDPVKPDDDFFALGGHSLLASRMAAELSRRLGLPVPLDTLFERPTAGALAARLGEKIDPSRPRAIRLHPGPDDSPVVFWIHTLVDGGMGLFPYRQAARLLTGFTSYGIAEGTEPFDSIEEMAARHVEAIRSVQPQGPYLLTGFCFGGNLAAEVAWQLSAAGEKIGRLILLEAQPPGTAAPRRWWLRPWLWPHVALRLWQNLPRIAGLELSDARKRLSMKRRALSQSFSRVAGIPDIRAVLDLSLLGPAEQDRAVHHWAALHRHITRLPEDSRVAVVRAEGDGWLPRAAALGWDRLTLSPVEVRSLPGRHEDFLRGESSALVAATLSELLS